MKQVLRLGRLPRAERSKRGWSRTQVELAAESSRMTLSVVAVHVSHSKLWLTVASPALRSCQDGSGGGSKLFDSVGDGVEWGIQLC